MLSNQPDRLLDFPDSKREMVIQYLFNKYGYENVCHISNINRLKAKSAIDEFGRSLCIPKYEIDVLKDSIAREAKERLIIERIRQGERTLDVYNFGNKEVRK